MPTYLVTGATGFLGRNLLPLLLARPDAQVLALVRPGSQGRLRELAAGMAGGERVIPLPGDLTAPRLGLSEARVAELRAAGVDHVVHLAAVYDMTADPEVIARANVDGTRAVIELAAAVDAGRLHHVSSVAVAGDHVGVFTEDDFDLGQPLTSPYHSTKFLAEEMVRADATVPWRIYRPAVVVGNSISGEMDKVDGPYYVFGSIARLRALPTWVPIAAPDIGDTNIVPVDYVAAAMDHLMHADGLDGRAFHLVNPEPQPLLDVVNALCRAAGAPAVTLPVPRRVSVPLLALASLATRLPGVAQARDVFATGMGIPPEVLPHMAFRTVFASSRTQEALAGSGLSVPAFDDYAGVLWSYWETHLDPDRARRARDGGPLVDRTVVITGASSGIGRSVALQVAAAGGIPLLVARSTERLEEVRAEIEAAGGRAGVYSCDITDGDSVDALIKQLLADHDGIDMLVNNAGRSIRRSVKLSYDRLHDYERTMALNYFGAVRLVLGLLPQMTERRFGHVVNVSSIGVQAGPPRFSAYVASKAALDAFSKVVASETFADHVTFTTVHMPLVRTAMIAPTRIYDRFPTISPDEAGEMVLRALCDRPKHIGTRLGTAAEVAYALSPKAVDAILHQAYRLFPDSAAAVAESGAVRHTRTGPEAALNQGLTHSAMLMARLLPGVHW